MSDPIFWSDDFDMDLPKVVPGARDELGALDGLLLWTYGSQSHGRLNHPSTWNHELGSVAFFGLQPDGFKPAAFYTNHLLVSCTLWEALRDAWAHDYAIILNGTRVWRGDTWQHFEPLMWHLRRWRESPQAQVDEHRQQVRERVRLAGVAVNGVVDRSR